MPRITRNVLDMNQEELSRFLSLGNPLGQSVQVLKKLREELSAAIQGFEGVIMKSGELAKSGQPLSQQEVESRLRLWVSDTITVDSPELLEHISASDIDVSQLSSSEVSNVKQGCLSCMKLLGMQYFLAKEKLELAKGRLAYVDAAIARTQTFAEQKGTIYRDSPLRSPLTIATDELMALQKDDRYMHFFKHYRKDNNRALRIACTDQSMMILDRLANIHRLQPIALDPNQRAGELQNNAFHIAAEKGGQAMYNKLVEFGFVDQGLLNTDGKKPNDYLQAHQARACA